VSCEEFAKAINSKEWGYAEEMNQEHNTFAAGSPTPSQVKLQITQPGIGVNTKNWTFETRRVASLKVVPSHDDVAAFTRKSSSGSACSATLSTLRCRLHMFPDLMLSVHPMHHIHAPNASALHFSDSFSSILQTDAHASGDTDMTDIPEQDL